jgi:hypothetical protein
MARQTVPAGRPGCVQTPEALQTSSVQLLPSSPHGTNGVDWQASVASLQVAVQSVAAAQGSPA